MVLIIATYAIEDWNHCNGRCVRLVEVKPAEGS